MQKYLNYLWVFLLITASLVTGILYSEYRFFCNESQKVLALQQQYKDYINEIKLIYEDAKDKLVEIPEPIELDEKKKPFNVVNRSPEYLRDSVVKYFLEKDLSSQLEELDKRSKAPVPVVKRRRRPTKKRKPRIPANAAYRFKGDKRFIWPIKNEDFWISSFFGRRRRKDKSIGFHYGLDMAAIKGIPVMAAESGRIVEASYVAGYGNMILISHDKTYKTKYAHLNSILVKPGQWVKKGQKIGTVGDTGFVRGTGKDASHLHFEVFAFEKAINPLYVLPW